MSEICEKILTEEQKKACDEIADVITNYDIPKPASVNLKDLTTINLQLVMAKDELFGKQKKFYQVFLEKNSSLIDITDITARATKNDYNFTLNTLIITGQYEQDLVKALGEQLYSAMYFAGYKDYVKREIKVITKEKNKERSE